MKAQIVITGQINGNFKLRNAISCDTQAKEGMFNSFIYEFPTKREAYKALLEAYKYLRSEGETTLSYSPKRYLGYDASYAEIK